jgi:hypothetical protein
MDRLLERVAAGPLLRHDLGVTKALLALVTCGFALVSGVARADSFHREARSDTQVKEESVDLTKAQPAKPPPAEPDWRKPLRERRCGFSVGVLVGPAVGAVSGYPNDALKIDRDEFFTDTGVAGGGAAGLWLGVAITDWLALGLTGNTGKIVAADHESDYFGGAFHLDIFPAYPLGGQWREVGVMFEAGVALSNTYPSDEPDLSVIESGVASHLDLGFFYEGIRAWKFSMGPFASVDLQWSPSAFRPTGWLGWRTALYAGP